MIKPGDVIIYSFLGKRKVGTVDKNYKVNGESVYDLVQHCNAEKIPDSVVNSNCFRHIISDYE